MKTKIDSRDSNVVVAGKVLLWLLPFAGLALLGFKLDGITESGHHLAILCAGIWLGDRWPWRKLNG